MSINHYENFPVASVLCPRPLRQAVTSIYWFARTADDLADEGDASPNERLSALSDYRDELHRAFAGQPANPRWAQVFNPLRYAIRQHTLPIHLLEDLLDAFEQDVGQQNYVNRAELLDYCKRSANPVGRLLLHLYGINSPEQLRQSDDICTALQLANFWQDLSIDTARGRCYVPLTDAAKHQVELATLMTQQDAPQTRSLVAELVEWTQHLMLAGAPLALALQGRAGWELRLVVQGGLRILEKVKHLHYASLRQRPKLSGYDMPVLLWRVLRMKRATPRPRTEARP